VQLNLLCCGGVIELGGRNVVEKWRADYIGGPYIIHVNVFILKQSAIFRFYAALQLYSFRLYSFTTLSFTALQL
jgi:hypothetical protein